MKSKEKRVAMWSDVYRQYLKQGAGPERSEELAHDAVARAERNGVFDEACDKHGAVDMAAMREQLQRLVKATNATLDEEQRVAMVAEIASWLLKAPVIVNSLGWSRSCPSASDSGAVSALESFGLARKVNAVRESPHEASAEPMKPLKATDEGHGGSGASEAQRERIVNHVHAFPISTQAKPAAEGDGSSGVASSYARVEYEPPHMAELRWREGIEKNFAVINEALAKPATVPPHWHVKLRAGATNDCAGVPAEAEVILIAGARCHYANVLHDAHAKNHAVEFDVIATTPVSIGDNAELRIPRAGMDHRAKVIAVH